MDIDQNMSNLSIDADANANADSIIENMTYLSMNEHEKYETYTDYDTSLENSIEPSLENTENYDMYDLSPYVLFGIPNIYCKHHFDDEDLIYNRYVLTNDIKKYIKINNSIDEYTTNYCVGNGIIVDYNCSNETPDIVYAKVLYIYLYIERYYKDLKYLEPCERIKHLPEDFLNWVENIVTILKKVVNDASLNCNSFISLEDTYFKELIYGLNIINSQLILMLNHYKYQKKYTLWQMEAKHIKQFFKIVNNMCVIIIFVRLNK